MSREAEALQELRDSLQVKDMYCTKNELYNYQAKFTTCKGVLIHDTATPGVDAERYAKAFNQFRPSGRRILLHAFCDDKGIINTYPTSLKCWGCGSGPKGSGNDYYVQIEMCLGGGIYLANGWQYKTDNLEVTRSYVLKTVDNVTTWAALELYRLGIREVNTTTVTSHIEANKAGIATAHTDPRDFLAFADLDMDKVRETIRNKLASISEGYIPAVEVKPAPQFKVGDTVKLKETAKQYNGRQIPEIYRLREYKIREIKGDRVVLEFNGVIIYAVNIEDILSSSLPMLIYIADEIDVRTGPGESFPIIAKVKDKGTYTIVEVVGTYGKLKSGLGWLDLNKVERR